MIAYSLKNLYLTFIKLRKGVKVMDNKLTLNMVVSDAIEAMEFYERVFNAERGEIFHFPDKKGENAASVIVGGIELRLIDENASYDCHPPKKDETDSIWLQLNVEDVESTLKRALENNAEVSQEVNEFMGTKHAEIIDPFGYTWTINQVIQEMTFEERYQFYVELQESEE